MASAENRARLAESLGRAGLTILQANIDYSGGMTPDVAMIDPEKNTAYLIAAFDQTDTADPAAWLKKSDGLSDCRAHVAGMFDDPVNAAWAAAVICRLGYYANAYGTDYDIPGAVSGIRVLVGMGVPEADAPAVKNVLDTLGLAHRAANLPDGTTFIAFNAANTDSIILLHQQAMAATLPDTEFDNQPVEPGEASPGGILAGIESADVLIAAVARTAGKFIVGLPLALVAFPILFAQLFSPRRIPALVSYTVLAAIAFAGGYEYLYGSLFSGVYTSAIAYSDSTLIASGAVLAVIDVSAFITQVLPGVSDIIEKLGSVSANGVLALAAQSILLRLISAGFMLKWALGIGLAMAIFAPLEKLGRRITVAVVMVYFLLPAVVAGQAWTYHAVVDKLVDRIAVETQAAGGALGQSVKAAEGAYYNFRAWAAGVMGNEQAKTELKQQAELRKDEVMNYGTTMVRLLVRLVVAVTFFLVIAPLIAYWLLYRLILKTADPKSNELLAR